MKLDLVVLSDDIRAPDASEIGAACVVVDGFFLFSKVGDVVF